MREIPGNHHNQHITSPAIIKIFSILDKKHEEKIFSDKTIINGSLDPSDSQSSLSSFTFRKGRARLISLVYPMYQVKYNMCVTQAYVLYVEPRKQNAMVNAQGVGPANQWTGFASSQPQNEIPSGCSFEVCNKHLHYVNHDSAISYQGTIRENISIQNIIKVCHRTEPNLAFSG
jgi:hypothetical protein